MLKKQFMQRAVELSQEKMRANIGGPFGAVVVRGGKIVGEGWNKVTTKNDPTAHAEVEAIRDACKNLNTFDLKDCEIYTSCEPCPMCLAAIYWARIGKMYFGNTRKDAALINFDDDFLYEQVALPVEKRTLQAEQLLRDEAFAVFKEWQVKPDKTVY